MELSGLGDINVDPLFFNTAKNNFHLQTGSPCLGKGISITGITTDLDGNVRSNPPSIGAYEKGFTVLPPVATVQSVTINTNTAKSIALIASDPNTPALPLTYSIGLSPTHGTLSGLNAATGAVTYTPATGFVGADNFSFKVNNGYYDSATVVVSITVGGKPTATAQSVTTAYNTAKSFTLTGSDSNIPPQPLTYSIVTGPSRGALSALNGATGAVTYTPFGNYIGADSFTFKVNNGSDSAPATVSITVAGTPTANAQSVAINKNTAKSITLTGSDPNTPPQPLTYSVVTSPTHGTLSGAAPNLTYTPATGYVGADSFTFKVNNGSYDSAPATVSITVNANTHVLWTNTDGTASLWNYNTTGGTFTQNTYGPYAGWTAIAIADGGTDGLTRVLWDNTNGTASIWSLDTTTGAFTQFTFGPYAGWAATALSVGPDNTTHVLWLNANGTASLWNYSATGGTFTQNTYGPYSGWTAAGLADGPDGKVRLLWDNADGTMSLWSLDNVAAAFGQFSFGPYANWTAKAISVAPDNTTHVLWANTNGTVSLWNYSATGGTFTQNTYGPYTNWAAKVIADGSDGKTRVLWDNTDGTASIWSLDNATGAFTQNSFGPYAGWTATAISAP